MLSLKIIFKLFLYAILVCHKAIKQAPNVAIAPKQVPIAETAFQSILYDIIIALYTSSYNVVVE